MTPETRGQGPGVAGGRLRRLEALLEIEREILQLRDPEALLGLIGRRATELLQADSATVYLLDEAAGLLRPHASFNIGDWIRDVPIPLGHGVVGRTTEAGTGMIVNDYPRSPYAITPFRERDWAILSQPLLSGGVAKGVILVRRAEDRPFTPADLTQLGDFAVQASIALENARLLALASSRAERVKAAAEVGRLLASTRDADRILDLIAEKCREVLGARAFGLFRPDASGRLRYARGFGLDEAFLREHVLDRGEGVVGRAVEDRRTVQSVDLLHDPAIELSSAARMRIAGVGSRAVVGVPLVVGDEVLGALAVYHPPGFRIPAEEVEFLETLATHAAVALENARLFAETRRRQETAECLNRLGRAMSASLRLDAVLDQVVQAVGTLLAVPLVAIWVADEERRVLARGAGHGAPELLAQVPTRLAYGEAGAGWVAEHRVPLLDVSVADDPRIARRELAVHHGITFFSGIPVLIGDRLLGVLALGGRREAPLSPADVALVETLLGHAAIALENARLYEEARRHEAEAVRAYQDLRTAQEQLVLTEKLRALGEMASGVAHDFNNILAVVLGRVQVMARQVADPEVRRWLDVVEEAALRGAETVRQLQEFTRVRRDQPSETVDLGEVARAAVLMTQGRWRDETQSQGIDVRVVLDLQPVPPVDGHPAELREALTNLILNAVDALPRGGTITVSTRHADDRVVVQVADTGVGMPDDVRRRLFEPFFTTKGPKGTGLGLAMVYGIVSRHGGQVSGESQEGVGSTFAIRLPVGKSRRPVAGAPLSPVAEGAARILVIDDEPHVRDTLADMLRLKKHEVVVASRGEEGIEQFRAGGFDLVMTDLAMPGLSGWQVAQAAKALRPGVPVVLVTGWGVELDPEQLRQSGVDRVLAKPFRLSDVLEMVAGLRGGGSGGAGGS